MVKRLKILTLSFRIRWATPGWSTWKDVNFLVVPHKRTVAGPIGDIGRRRTILSEWLIGNRFSANVIQVFSFLHTGFAVAVHRFRKNHSLLSKRNGTLSSRFPGSNIFPRSVLSHRNGTLMACRRKSSVLSPNRSRNLSLVNKIKKNYFFMAQSRNCVLYLLKL